MNKPTQFNSQSQSDWELTAYNNQKITDINHMNKLVKLDASGNSGLDDQGISQLNLIELNACDNPKITDLNHMNKLVKLNANGMDCGLNDKSIGQLNLIKLTTYNNQKITDINHMSS